MIKIKILSIGKTKESWLEQAIKEYTKRLTPSAEITFALAKDEAQLIQQAEKEQHVVSLDTQGRLMNSEEFACFLHNEIEKGGSRIAFVIGGPEGLPPLLKEKSLISLSPMVFTHQIARLILIEQIYRAFEIFKGSKYHK